MYILIKCNVYTYYTVMYILINCNVYTYYQKPKNLVVWLGET